MPLDRETDQPANNDFAAQHRDTVVRIPFLPRFLRRNQPKARGRSFA